MHSDIMIFCKTNDDYSRGECEYKMINSGGVIDEGEYKYITTCCGNDSYSVYFDSKGNEFASGKITLKI